MEYNALKVKLGTEDGMVVLGRNASIEEEAFDRMFSPEYDPNNAFRSLVGQSTPGWEAYWEQRRREGLFEV